MNDIVKTEPLQKLIARARATLDSATSAAEILEAHERASVAYDQAKIAERLAKAKGAHDDMLATCRQLMADAAEIEARAEVRLADEYDAAQARGEVAKQSPGRPSKMVSDENHLPTQKDIGVTKPQVHKARKVRDAEKADPGVVKRTLDRALEEKRTPLRADVSRAVDGALNKSKPKSTVSPCITTPETVHLSPDRLQKLVDRLTGEMKKAQERVTALEAENGRLKAANSALRAGPNNTPTLAPEGDGLICSFCSKASTEVAIIIAGRHALICNECVPICVEVIAKNEKPKAEDAPTPVEPAPAGAERDQIENTDDIEHVDRSADDVLVEIHTALKRGAWPNIDNGATDRVILGDLFWETQAIIHADLGPKPEPKPVAKLKAWQTKADKAMQRFIERASKQDGYFCALSLRRIEGFIKEARTAQRGRMH